MRSMALSGKLCVFLAMAVPSVMAQQAESTAPATATALIATDSTEFRDALLKEIQAGLDGRKETSKVIKLGELEKEDADNYKAVVVIAAMRAFRLQKSARTFLDKLSAEQKKKVIVVVTRGSSGWKAEGIHAVTTASEKNQVAPTAEYVRARLDEILTPTKTPARNESATVPADSRAE